MNNKLIPMTEEQRTQSRLARIADQEYATTHLKTKYADLSHWQSLCSKYGCKMPGWWYPITDIKYMRRVAKRTGIDMKEYVESTGYGSIKEFAQANEKLTAVAGVGLILEWVDEYKTNTL